MLFLAAGARLFADEGPRFLGERGGVAILEHDGSNYDKLDAEGKLNVAPRARLVSEFIRTHGDFYDFVVIFTNFNFDFGNLDGFYLGVRNDVQGIGLPAFDNGPTFGSPSRLQGVIQMGPVAHYRQGALSLDPADPRFRATVGVVAHELGHRFLARARFVRGGEMSTDLLGLEGNHWSYLLSSDASFMYGSDWRPNGDGTFTAIEIEARYSALDLYLMGFLHAEEVPPFVLLRNADVPAEQIPVPGARIAATPETIGIEQILAAEGARLPDASRSQKNFNLAFIFLTKKDVLPSAEDLAAVETVRTAFVSTFFSSTLGRAYVDTDLISRTPPDPAVIPDPSRGLAWLLAQQKPDGRWEDAAPTALRDTSVVLEALDALGVRGEEAAAGLDWISREQPASVDFLARAMKAGAPHSPASLLSRQNGDGGFGIGPGYRSDPLDTALAVSALSRAAVPAASRRPAAQFLLSVQRADGSWPSVRGGEGDLLGTYHVVLALQSVAAELPDLNLTPAIQKALAFLVGRQQPDGGFGDGPSTPYATAEIVELLQTGGGPLPVIEAALGYLARTQSEDGSWNRSVFQTAAVLKTLVPASLANLSIAPADVVLNPDPPEVGERVAIEVTVRNRSRVAADAAFQVELFDGDPEAGGEPVGIPVEIPGLAAAGAALARFDWDTAGREGPHTLFAVADLAGVVREVSKRDNLATRSVEVLPPLPNLVVESLTVVPDNPPEGTRVELTARVANRGSREAFASLLRFHDGVPALEIVLDEAPLPPLAPGASVEVSGTWDTSGGLGRHDIFALADALNAVRERKENDNSLSRLVNVRVPPPKEPDLVLTAADLSLTPSRLERLPQPTSLRARVHNTGTDPVPEAEVELFLGDPAAGGVRLDGRTVAVPGDSAAEVSFEFTVTGPGSKTYFVAVDRAGRVVERDETNNLASTTLIDLGDTVDVELVAGTLSLSPPALRAGETLSVEVDVANRGTRSLAAVAVALFFRDGADGPLVLASSVNLSLPAGAVARARLRWKANRVGTIEIRLKADPADVLPEVDETNNEAAATVEVTDPTEPNLSVSSADVTLSPAVPEEGRPADISARVRNVGTVDAGPFEVAFFAGDPARAGLFIGKADVASLAARGETTVTGGWPEVSLRGSILVYVVADRGGAIQEFDEDDNTTFKVVEVKGLPDLLASAAQVRLSPAFPRSGDPVTIEAAFTNAGGQGADSFEVEIRLDDPEAGPVLASHFVSSLPAGATTAFSTIWDTVGVTGEHSLFLVLDVGGSVREQQEANNRIRVPVALQDKDTFVSPPYFSPNGDGVQDQATFFYRVEAGEVTVRVLDGEQVPARTLLTGGPANGNVVWDGRSERGTVAPDGAYFFVVESEQGELLRRRVVLDTNRGSVVDALGTRFVSTDNLTCPLPAAFRLSGPAWLPDDSAAFFILRDFDPKVPDFPRGLYRVSADGSALQQIAAGERFADMVFEGLGAPVFSPVSPDGREALVRTSSSLEILNLATGDLRPLADAAARARWSPDGRRILVYDASGIFVHASGGGPPTQIAQGDIAEAVWSPDGLRIAYHRRGDFVLRTVSVDGNEDREVPGSDARELVLLVDTFISGDVFLELLFWSRDAARLYLTWGGVGDAGEGSAGPFVLDVSTGAVRLIRVGREVSSDQRWYIDDLPSNFRLARRVDGREARVILPASEGSVLRWSRRDTRISFFGGNEASPADCPAPDIWALRSLLNGEAALRLTRLPSGFGVKIAGSAADLNLSFFTLEFAPVDNPDAFSPIQPPSNVAVANDVIATWLPPAPGDYLVRLAVRDLAGNETLRVERIFWAETLPIANLTRAPEHISPNDDGVQDQTTFSYTVLEPVNLVFTVRGEDGRTVRIIRRDEGPEAVGRQVSFAWDGTDEVGNRVLDGVYSVEVRGAEFKVVVDASPPSIRAAYTALYTSSREFDQAKLVADLEGSVRDPNLVEWRLQTADGEEIRSGPRQILEQDDGGPSVIVAKVPARQDTEIRAVDLAGNVVVRPLSVSREMRIIVQGLSSRAFAQAEGIGPFAPGPPVPPPRLLLPVDARFGWGVSASAPVADLVFRYRKEGEEVFRERPPGGFLASEFEIGERYQGHFAAGDLRSQDVSFVVGREAIFITPTYFNDRILVDGFSTVREELVEASLILNLNGAESTVRVYRPFPETIHEEIPATLFCTDRVWVSVVARGASGRIYHSTTKSGFPGIGGAFVAFGACLSVTDVQAERQTVCEEGEVSETLMVSVSGKDLPQPATEVALLVSGKDIPPTEVGRVRPPAGETEFSVRIPWDIGGLAEGEYRLSARAFFADGSSRDSGSFSLALDASPPQALVESPPEGGNVCLINDRDKELVEIDVVGRDQLITQYTVERLVSRNPDRWEVVPAQPVDPVAPLPRPVELRQKLRVEIPPGFEGELTLRVAMGNSRVLGELPKIAEPGNNGALLGCAVRRVLVLRSEPLGLLSAVPGMEFSPNGDGRLDEVSISGELSETARVTARVFPIGGNAPVRTLSQDVPFAAGPLPLAWNGKNDAGVVVADALYRVEVEAVNGCGTRNKRILEVEVDTTPPVAEIDSPIAGQKVVTAVEVTGTATDKNFRHYLGEAGEGEMPAGFVLVFGPVEGEREARLLGTWDVGALVGLHTLRLTAEDRAGNLTQRSVTVDARSPDLIERLQAAPVLFSPNGDSVLDSTEIFFRLKAESRVTLEARGANETVRLLSDALLPAGDHTIPWGGLGANGVVADGRYQVVLAAVDAAGPATEGASVSLFVDTVAPALRVDNLSAGAHVQLPRELLGAVQDANLEGFTVEVAPEQGPPVFVQNGTRPLVGPLARLPELADGVYRLRLNAEDLAGNRAETSFLFTADGTSPALTFTAPAEGAHLKRKAAITIRARVSEPNLESYLLQFGLGSPPRALVALASGAVVPPEGLSVEWPVAELPDGLYTLRLSAVDRAGGRAEVDLHVTLDGAAPTVALSEPAEGAFLAEAGTVSGTAADANLAEWVLEVSPGRPQEAFQFSELARDTTSRENAELTRGVALEDGDYTLRLTATDLAGNRASSLRGLKSDRHPPSAPVGLVASAERDNVRLSWQANLEPDVAGYLVYRGEALLTPAPIPAPEYLDPGRPEGRHRYTVRAVDRAGLRSEPSSPAEAVVDLTPPTVALRAPEEGASVRGLVDMVGTAFSDDDFKEYRLTVAPAAAPESRTLLKRSPAPISFGTLFQWDAIALDGKFILRLEAEDIRGNLAASEVRVEVDNRPPSQPVLLAVDVLPDPDDLEVRWRAVDDADLDGYILLRNGQVANAPGQVGGDLRQYLIRGTSYKDLDLPDGNFCYRVAAMDRAGNLGPESNEICRVLDNRAPAATIFDPPEGARFDQPRRLRAVSADQDIASVLFQYRKDGEALWTDIGRALAAPYEVIWDVTGLAFGDYFLRAVATDVGSRSDPSPAAIRVTLEDVTPPLTPTDLRARVTGDDVSLSWSAVVAPDLAGYRLYRNGVLVATLAPGNTTATDSDLSDGTFSYGLTAFDAKDNESPPSAQATARVYAPVIPQPFPIYETLLRDLSGSAATPEATVRLERADTGDPLGEPVVADAAGVFLFKDLALPEGLTELVSRATDAAGNLSRPSDRVALVRNVPPAPPENLQGVGGDTTASLSWTAPEPDLAYLVRRDGARVQEEAEILSGRTASASSFNSGQEGPDKAIDDNAGTAWVSRTAAVFAPQWLEIQVAPPRHLREVAIFWQSFFRAARDYRILVELEGKLVEVARMTGNVAPAVNRHRFPRAFRTGKLRLEITALQFNFAREVGVQELDLTGENPILDTAFTDTPPRSGIYDYTVTSLDGFGGESEPAGPLSLGVGDVVPPEPPTDLVATAVETDVLLVWSASPAADVVGYRIYRNGERVAEVSGTDYADRGLRNGIYTYQVSAVDAASNEGGRSNEAVAEVAVSLPQPPANLRVAGVEEGRALDLAWDAAFGPRGVAGYVVLRSVVRGGPYAEIARAPATVHRDSGLENGVEYFYVVRAFDPVGNESADSNEASGIPRDSLPPDAPTFLYPAAPDRPATVSTRRVDLVGTAEAGAMVTIFRGGDSVGATSAEPAGREAKRLPQLILQNTTSQLAMSGAKPQLAVGLPQEVRLLDLVNGLVEPKPFEALSYSGFAYSPSGTRLAMSAEKAGAVSADLFIMDLTTGALRVLVTGENERAPQWISEGEMAVVVDSEIRAVDLQTETTRLVFSGFGFISRLLVSPDGTHIAFDEDPDLKVVPVGGGAATTVSPGTSAFDCAWAGDGRLAYTSLDGLSLYDVESATSTLVPDTAGAERPRALPDGRLSFLRAEGGGLSVYIVELDGSVRSAVELDFLSFAPFFAEWSPDLRLVMPVPRDRGEEFSVLVPGGRFELSRVVLQNGDNDFVARAQDGSGNESAPSLPARVRFDGSGLPDLAPEGQVGLVPAVPLRGQKASLSLRVRNLGGAASTPTLVQATGQDTLGGLYTMGSATLPGLPPDASAAVSFLWDTANRLGRQEITIEIDPLGALDEADEANNRASRSATVVGDAGVEISVSTGRAVYGAQENLQAFVQAVNGGPTRSVALRSTIEDASGAQVAFLESRVAVLAYGQSLAFSVFWNTGTTAAGDYRVRVSAFDGSTPLGSATAPFSITRSLNLRARISSEKPSYFQGESVRLLGEISDAGGNAALRDLTAVFRVAEAGGAVVFETTAAVAYLARGGTASVESLWPAAGAVPGEYNLRLEFLEKGTVLMTASSSVTVVKLIRPTLGGSLEVDEAVGRGALVLARFRVENRSPVDANRVAIRVALFDPRNGLTRAFQDFEVDLPAGGSFSGEAPLETRDAPFGPHRVVLSAGVGGARESLAAREVTLFGTPSAPSLNAPAEGASASQPLRLSVNNGASPNRLPLSYSFEIYLDPELRLAVASASGVPEGVATTGWVVPIRLEENRRYYWRARAQDRLAGSDWMSRASLFLDSLNEPPGEPSLSAPAEGSEVALLQPELEVGNAVDPEGASLTYSFELYSDPALTDQVAVMAGVPGGPGVTSTTVPVALEEDRSYFWRARASDGALEGDWMPAASFRVNTGNQPPGAATPRSPLGFSASVSPELVAAAASDPEGDSLTYTFEIDESPRFDSPALQRADGVLPGADEVRWAVPLPLRENQKYFWRVRATDGRATGDWSELAAFRVNETNEAPSAPALQSPTGGVLVATFTPTLTLVNSSDPEEDVLTYELEVYADAGLTEKMAGIERVREGEIVTGWVVSPRLTEDKVYYWRARAHDGLLPSLWSLVESFRVNVTNAAPGAPSLAAPPDGGRVSEDPPTLSVFNAVDPEGDGLTYEFELYEDEQLSVPVDASPPVDEGPDRTSWQVTQPLVENAVYYWRARAFDGELYSSWMPTARFRLSLRNESPGVPVLLAPADGAEVSDSRPLLVVQNTSDPDGDALRYVFEVFSDAALGVPVVTSPDQDEGSGTTSWQLSVDLAENAVFYWRAFATDGLLAGPPSEPFQFRVNAVHDPPTAPTPVEPPDGAEVPTTSVRLVVRNASSPDTLRLHYHFMIATDEQFGGVVAQNDAVPEGNGETAWDVPVDLANGVTYFWRVRAIDEGGLDGPWSVVARFTVVLPTPGCPPEWREDFEKSGPGSQVLDGWRLRVDRAHLHFHIERHQKSRWLASVPSGTGALLFVGSGESRSWKNYTFTVRMSVRRQSGDDDDDDEEDDDDDEDDDDTKLTTHKDSEDDDCRYGAGVVFYANLERDAEYRLEIAGTCQRPELRLVKRSKGTTVKLTSTLLELPGQKRRSFFFSVEAVTLAAETSIRARVVEEETGREWRVEAQDARDPLRAGTVGAWSDRSKTLWDDFFVQEIPGLESGISGDEDGDGVCDSEECPEGSDVCLDEGYDSDGGRSHWVVDLGGAVGHSGKSACGEKHSYWIAKRSGFLVVETPELAAGIYRFQLLLERRTPQPTRVKITFPNNQIFEISAGPGFPNQDFAWSEPIPVSLPAGVSRFRIESVEKTPVHLEAFRLEPRCEP